MLDLFQDLFAYNDWANQKTLALCEGLSDSELDAQRDMGFGTLRATVFHILAAEVIWMERWQGVPWREFPTNPNGISIEQIGQDLVEVAERRRQLLQSDASAMFQRRVQYQDSRQTPYDHVLFDLLMHVANHGVHHRAQALNYLKQYDRTVVGGLDYLFYRLASHPARQTPEARESLTSYGLAVGQVESGSCPWDAKIARRFFQYHDWAMGQMLGFVTDLSDEALDRDFAMGPGSIRKTLLHLLDAEAWWIGNWTTGPHAFPHSAPETPVSEMVNKFGELQNRRNTSIDRIDDQSSQQVIEILAGGPATRVRVGESVIHLASHGTHHRAQLINMCRHVGAPWKNIDLLYAIAELPGCP